MDQQVICFRPAIEEDEDAIRALLGGAQLSANGVGWANATVAAIGSRIVGALRIRKHADGSRELGSVVVAEDKRHQGIASRMMETMFDRDREPMWLIANEDQADSFRQWGFARIEPCTAPVRVRRSWRVGSVKRLMAFMSPSFVSPGLVILERLPLERRRHRRLA